MVTRLNARWLVLLGLVSLFCVASGAAQAASIGVQFRDIGIKTGMDAVWANPTQRVEDIAFFVDLDSGLDYTLVQELYEEGSSTPVDEVAAGVAYSSIVTLTMGELPDDPNPQGQPRDEILLLVMGVSNDQSATPPHPIYTTDDIALIVNQPGATPFDTAVYEPRSEGAFYYYLGYALGEGETVTFRYDVAEQAIGGTPVFFTRGTYDYELVPEPSTALLMGLGLFGLSFAGNRPKGSAGTGNTGKRR